MKKKLLLSSLFLLAASSVWAEEVPTPEPVQVTNGNITYKMTLVESAESGDPEETDSYFDANAKENENYVVTVRHMYSHNTSKTEIYKGYPVSADTNDGTVSSFTMQKWSNSYENNKPVVENTETDYETVLSKLTTENPNIVKITEGMIVLFKDYEIKRQGKKEVKSFFWSEDADYDEEDNPISKNTYLNKYAYYTYVDSWDDYYYVLIDAASIYTKTTGKETVNATYTPTSIKNGFICEGIKTLTLNDEIVSIENNAFKDADPNLVVRGSQNKQYGNDSEHLYNHPTNPTRLIWVNANDEVFFEKLPASLETIDACAYKNVSNRLVYLPKSAFDMKETLDAAEAEAKKEFPNTFVTNTLTEGTIADWHLDGGSRYTIPSTITTIEEGAFMYAENLTSFLKEENDMPFAIRDNLLLSGNTVLAAANNLSGEVTLDPSYTRVGMGAFANIKQPLVVKSTNSSLEVADCNYGYDEEETGCGKNVVWQVASPELIQEPDANGGINVTGVMTKDNMIAIDGNVPYYDFTGVNLLTTETLQITNETNSLLYFAQGAKVAGNNVIVGNQCAKFILNDSIHTKFFAKTGFIASHVEYTRKNIVDKWQTICLPFALTTSDFERKYQVGSLEDYDYEKNVFTFKYASTMNANTPYIIKKYSNGNDGGDVIEGKALSMDGTFQIEATNNNLTSTKQEASFVGVFETTKKACDNTDMFYSFKASTGLLVRLDGATLYPFRAYLTAPTAHSDEAPSIRIVDAFDNELEVIESGNATGIQDANAAAANAENGFNLYGQRVNNKSNIQIVNGKKLIIK